MPRSWVDCFCWRWVVINHHHRIVGSPVRRLKSEMGHARMARLEPQSILSTNSIHPAPLIASIIASTSPGAGGIETEPLSLFRSSFDIRMASLSVHSLSSNVFIYSWKPLQAVSCSFTDGGGSFSMYSIALYLSKLRMYIFKCSVLFSFVIV